MKLGHVAIRVKDVDKSVDYYCNGLGLTEAFRIFNDDGSLRIVYLHISDYQYLEICAGGKTKPDFNDQEDVGVRHICFTVDNLERFKKEAEERDVVFDSEILKLRDNNLTAFLFDIDGNKLEIVEVQEDSPHRQFELSSIK